MAALLIACCPLHAQFSRQAKLSESQGNADSVRALGGRPKGGRHLTTPPLPPHCRSWRSGRPSALRCAQLVAARVQHQRVAPSRWHRVPGIAAIAPKQSKAE